MTNTGRNWYPSPTMHDKALKDLNFVRGLCPYCPHSDPSSPLATLPPHPQDILPPAFSASITSHLQGFLDLNPACILLAVGRKDPLRKEVHTALYPQNTRHSINYAHRYQSQVPGVQPGQGVSEGRQTKNIVQTIGYYPYRTQGVKPWML